MALSLWGKKINLHFTSLFLILAVLLAISACSKQQESTEHIPLIVYGPGTISFSGYTDTFNAQYQSYQDNSITQTAQNPLSTFSLNVGTASYANVRRFLESGNLPHPGAVRVEEMLNYFPLSDQNPHMARMNKSPFKASYELAPCPWNNNNVILYISLKTDDMKVKEIPPANLVFLVDVSGSMYSDERLPLVQSSLKMLVNELRPEDRISIVTYSGNVDVVLEPTSGKDKATINAAIEKLSAGGGTAGGAGLELAYKQAQAAFIPKGINRILLCTDGDFNLGIASAEELEAMVSSKRDLGITLSVLGYGTDNLNDAMMMKIADCGNGNYSYIDRLSEAQKVLGEEMRSTLVTVAKDVKAQIEFNPNNVIEYRQIGYDLRQLDAEEFNDDRVDAGDIGAGKDVIIMYELTLKGATPSIDPLRYQNEQTEKPKNSSDNELAFVKIRWKSAKALENTKEKSNVAYLAIEKKQLAKNFEQAGSNLRFYTAVAAYGQKLRNNSALEHTSWTEIVQWAENAEGADKNGLRGQFVALIKIAASLSK